MKQVQTCDFFSGLGRSLRLAFMRLLRLIAIGGEIHMKISEFDKTRDQTRVLELLMGEAEVLKRFRGAMESDQASIYIAEDAGTVIGTLFMQEFDSLSVTPTVFVAPASRRRGIGTELLRFLDHVLTDSPYERAELQINADEGIAVFLEKNGYFRYFVDILMERDNTPINPTATTDAALAERGIVVRNYRDEDYWAYHNIVGVGFYLMRQRAGLMPWYSPPSAYERKDIAKGYRNRYVMLDRGEIVAVCKIHDNDIALLGVRPDKQSQGYGTLLLSYWINRIITERQADKITIDVTQGNPAKALYQRMGFRDVGCRYGYVKFNKPDSRPKAPQGYANGEEIMAAFRLRGMAVEEMGLHPK